MALVGACASGCPGREFVRPYPPPKPETLVAYVRDVRERVPNLRAETRSDVRFGKERINLTVNIAAEWGGRLRFQAISPQGGTAADLASDGEMYCFLDVQKNCGECGTATAANVGRILGIAMPPDDVVAALVGATPVLPGAAATLRWDPREGREVLELRRDDLSQRIELQPRDDGGWNVTFAELRRADEVVWRIRHRDFHAVGRAWLPGKSLIEDPRAKEDALIVWKEQEVDVALPEAIFRIEIPSGLAPCR